MSVGFFLTQVTVQARGLIEACRNELATPSARQGDATAFMINPRVLREDSLIKTSGVSRVLDSRGLGLQGLRELEGSGFGVEVYGLVSVILRLQMCKQPLNQSAWGSMG